MPVNKDLHVDGGPDKSADAAKRGLKGMMGSGIYASKKLRGQAVAATAQAGEAMPSTGAAGLAGTGGKRQSQAILDGDVLPLGSKAVAAPATFIVATGAGVAGTFDATPANDGGQCEVLVYERSSSDNTEDGPFIKKVDMAADGAAHSVALPAAYAGVTVAVYCRRLVGTAPNDAPGRLFATRRTVAAHA